MRILLTGAGGFLGSHLLPLLAARHEVIAMGRRPRNTGAESVQWIEVDLAVSIDPARLPDRIDALLHLAQSRRFREFPAGGPDVFRVNVAATSELIDYALKAKARYFLLASTGTVYGGQDGPVTEDAQPRGEGYYAASKLAAEILLRPYSTQLAVCAARLFTLYGPGQSGMLIANLIDCVKRGEAITLAEGSDGPSFNPTYVTDAAAAITRAVEAEWQGTINVSAPETVSLRQLGMTIGEALGCVPHFRSVPGPMPISPTPDLARLAQLYDLRAFRSIREGLRLAVQTIAPSV